MPAIVKLAITGQIDTWKAANIPARDILYTYA